MASQRVTGLFVGRSTLDIVYACAAFPQADSKVDAGFSYMSGGGPALNAAAAFAGLGGRARLCSVIGEGPLADWVRQDVGRHGVEIFDAARGEADVLPVSSIMLTGSSRAIINPPLPARAAAPDEVLERVRAVRPDIVLSDGHLPELALPLLRWARETGASTVLDGGSWKPWTAELLPFVDAAIVSSRFRPPPAGDGSDPLEQLSRRIGAVAVTDGPGPIRWRAGGASGDLQPPAVQAVDTLGAGDIFHGAFCWTFATGGDFRASLETAAEVASRSCAEWGPRAWIAGRAAET